MPVFSVVCGPMFSLTAMVGSFRQIPAAAESSSSRSVYVEVAGSLFVLLH